MTTMRRTIPRGGGGGPTVKDSNDDNDEEEVVDLMYMMVVLPPIEACRVEHLKCLNTEREKVMEQYMQEIAALETKY